VPTARYFIDRNGARTSRILGRTGAGHIDIAREVLPQHRVQAEDDADHYSQMFRLHFMRVVEHDDGLVEIEYRGKLTSAQRRFLQEMEQAVKRVMWVAVDRG
jgi:hypothetical protein